MARKAWAFRFASFRGHGRRAPRAFREGQRWRRERSRHMKKPAADCYRFAGFSKLLRWWTYEGDLPDVSNSPHAHSQIKNWASHNPESFPPLRGAREFLQFGLGQLAVSDDRGEVIAHLADDVDREKQLFSRGDVIDSGRTPG